MYADIQHRRERECYKNYVQEDCIIMVEDNGNGTASNAIWAVAMIIIVALIAGVLYFTVLKGGGPSPTKKVDVDVTIPAR